MKEKKYGIIVSIVTMLTMLLIIVLMCCCGKKENECGIILNIIIGVLGSSIVTLIISVSDYLISKKETLEDYFDEVYKVIVAFNKIKYVPIDDRMIESMKLETNMQLFKMFDESNVNMDEILNYYDQNHYFDMHLEELTIDEKKQIILNKANEDISKIIKAMNSYLLLEDVNYEVVENAYRKISFFTDKPKMCRKVNNYRIWLYETFHEKLRSMLRSVHMENLHFIQYENHESNNLYVVATKIRELNNIFFETKCEKGILTIYPKFYYDMLDDLEEFRTKIYKCEKKERMKPPIYTKVI
ncbi:MAG: hypothetical protein IKU15_09425 [Clostridia bacterium]|nr:hypothetical protein [Clostridia bacterium]